MSPGRFPWPKLPPGWHFNPTPQYLDTALGVRLLALVVVALGILHLTVGLICDRLPLCADPTCPEHHAE